ncbi:MAG: histidinol dehydrogenase, partial [Actinobacteria bacterium]|nr:histidinol dehydrogenase [Actinomycetota bacterium]
MRRIVLEEGRVFDESVLEREGVLDPDVLTATAAIVGEVRKRKDEALFEFTEKFDHVTLTEFRVPDSEIDDAYDSIDVVTIEALEYAASAIWDFHDRSKSQSWFTTRPDGSFLGSKVTPLDSVGIYIPGGRAQYPSTVLMNAIPAKVAGVEKIVMVAPPSVSGTIDPCTLAAARIAGVDEVYRVGGAHAIAALAYGTESIPRVCKITGPGNAYVAAAKKLVSGDVGIDMIAGPSEVCILADMSAEPELVAIDLMAQAEHDPKASCYLVTFDEEFVEEVEECLETLLAKSPREDITRTALLDRGLAVVCPSFASAIATINTIAPEHLELHVIDAMELLGAIRNAGAIFVGEYTPESVGDYVAGPNHTLPTGGTARFSSPLSVDAFVKRSSVISYTLPALVQDAEAITTIANREGLWAHAEAVNMRIDLVQAEFERMNTIEHDEGCSCGSCSDE